MVTVEYRYRYSGYQVQRGNKKMLRSLLASTGTCSDGYLVRYTYRRAYAKRSVERRFVSLGAMAIDGRKDECRGSRGVNLA